MARVLARLRASPAGEGVHWLPALRKPSLCWHARARARKPSAAIASLERASVRFEKIPWTPVCRWLDWCMHFKRELNVQDPRLEGGYESVPTRDIHMKQVGMEPQWLFFLQHYVQPLQQRVYEGYWNDVSRLNVFEWAVVALRNLFLVVYFFFCVSVAVLVVVLRC